MKRLALRTLQSAIAVAISILGGLHHQYVGI